MGAVAHWPRRGEALTREDTPHRVPDGLDGVSGKQVTTVVVQNVMVGGIARGS